LWISNNGVFNHLYLSFDMPTTVASCIFRIHLIYSIYAICQQQSGHEIMTTAQESTIAPRVGRKMRWPESIRAKFAAGTLERIRPMLGKNEARLDFIREAVERELVRRAKFQRKSGKRT
jgi:hypothetical protein